MPRCYRDAPSAAESQDHGATGPPEQNAQGTAWASSHSAANAKMNSECADSAWAHGGAAYWMPTPDSHPVCALACAPLAAGRHNVPAAEPWAGGGAPRQRRNRWRSLVPPQFSRRETAALAVEPSASGGGLPLQRAGGGAPCRKLSMQLSASGGARIVGGGGTALLIALVAEPRANIGCLRQRSTPAPTVGPRAVGGAPPLTATHRRRSPVENVPCRALWNL
jgi:hypothetical protein